MSKISAYAGLTAPVGTDVVAAVDVSDTTMAGTGTTKKLALSDLATLVNGFTGLEFHGVTATPSTPVVISATTITNAILNGYVGLYLDPRQIWDMTGLVIAPASFPSLPAGISNFRITMGALGSLGWTGNISHGPGYIKTDTATAPADGIQIYSDGTFETQGIVFENCVIIGGNSNAVVHLGGRQRRCSFPGTFIYNTNATRTTVAAGSNGVDVTTFVGSSTLNVASSASFASSGNVVVATSTVMATIHYTGKGSGTLTGCTTLGGIGTLSTGGTVGQAAFGLVADTALADFNSENSDFPNMSIAGGNCALGAGINDITQHFNDSLFTGLTTSAGLVSVVACTASNLTFINFYDRSSPTLCTVANHGGVLTFEKGEALNGSTSGPHDLVNTGAGTVYGSRTLTQVTATNTIVVAGGTVQSWGRCRWAGTIPMSNSGKLMLSAGGSYTSLTITGSSGTLFDHGQYVGGSGTAPNIAGFSGTRHTSTWT